MWVAGNPLRRACSRITSSALSFSLALTGKFRDAEAALDRAVRLRPHDKMLGFCLPAKAIARYQVGEYGDALDVARRAVAIQPRFWLGLQMLMASLVQTGAIAEIPPVVEAVRAIDADLTAEAFAARVPYRDPAHRLHVADALRKAGLG
jgi:tetratricopeptide (TPR) repeat protein